ncbi:MAG: vanadium-dependent haloperoxidase [Candidatus Cyclobacteriaceae bacterium M2_1C_046]
MKRVFNIVFLVFFLVSCVEEKKIDISPNYLHNAMEHLTDVIVHDIFSPPVASRIYAYPSIASYEIMALKDSAYRSLAGQLKDLEPIPSPTKQISYEIAAVNSFLTTAQILIFSEDKIKEFRNEFINDLKEKGVDKYLLQNSLEYGNLVSSHILKWADKDNYKQTRTFQKHTVSNKSGSWQPTPPAYMEAIEPHWSQIRSFVIDSASQFPPGKPTAFDMTEGSPFHKEVMEVYETANNLDEEQAEIASFWDCNPYVMNVHGHVMFATKKITPGGHWMGIAKIAAQKDSADMMKTTATYALTSIALADGFISCWDEKYKSNLIRPETVINKYIDEEWQPLLQTPPFPEYTSGHSVISSAAAVALTSIYGEPFHYIDDTEVKYGLPARQFESFIKASEEAAISRLYGGIHYMPAITNGVDQGRRLGHYIVSKVQLKEE